MPYLKNKGPLLVDKVRGYFDRLPPWLRDRVTFRVEKQKVDAEITQLDSSALESELKQEVTDEKLRTNRFIGDGEPGSGNDLSGLPASHPSEVVIPATGQVANVTETVSTSEQHLVEGPPLQDGASEQVGDVWVKKEVTAPTFDDKVFQLTREDLLPAAFKALVPEKLEAHTVDGTASLPTLGSGETVRREEQKKVGVKTVSTQSRDMTTPPVLVGKIIDPKWNGAEVNTEQKIVPAGSDITQAFGTTDLSVKPIDGTNALQEKQHAEGFPVLDGTRKDPEFNGAKVTLERVIVPPGTPITEGFGVVSSEVKPIDAVHSSRETWLAEGMTFPTLTQLNYDAELNQSISTEVSIVNAASTYTPGAYTLDYSERKIDASHKMRVVNHAYALNFETTYETRNFTFPALLFSLSFQLAATAVANRWEPQWTAGVRAAFTIPVRVQTNVNYYYTQPAATPVIAWVPSDIMFKGVSYSISLTSIIYNTWSNIGVTYAADAKYGNLVDRFSITATYPDATLYTSWIGTTQCISSVVSRYKRLWVKKDSYIELH